MTAILSGEGANLLAPQSEHRLPCSHAESLHQSVNIQQSVRSPHKDKDHWMKDGTQ